MYRNNHCALVLSVRINVEIHSQECDGFRVLDLELWFDLGLQVPEWAPHTHIFGV